MSSTKDVSDIAEHAKSWSDLAATGNGLLSGSCREEAGRIEDICDEARLVGMRFERARALKLVEKMHNALMELDLGSATYREKVLLAIVALGHEISTGLDGEDSSDNQVVESVSDDSQIDQVINYYPEPNPEPNPEPEPRPEPKFDGSLADLIVRLMAKAGTRKNGRTAFWTVEEIWHGLQNVAPDVPVRTICDALVRLEGKHIAESTRATAGVISYWLVDDYEVRLDDMVGSVEPAKKPSPEEALQDAIREELQSNYSQYGVLLPRSQNGLYYAVRDRFPWVSSFQIPGVARLIPGCKEIEPGNFLWVGDSRQTIPTKKPEQEAAQRPRGVVEVADAIYAMLRAEAVFGHGRIWEEYDIMGLAGRGADLGVKLLPEHFAPETMRSALDFLVAEKKLEVVPPSAERPWQKQPGWRVIR